MSTSGLKMWAEVDISVWHLENCGIFAVGRLMSNIADSTHKPCLEGTQKSLDS